MKRKSLHTPSPFPLQVRVKNMFRYYTLTATRHLAHVSCGDVADQIPQGEEAVHD